MNTEFLQPNTRLGEFVLVRQLGRGGMGDVWMAMDTHADRPVALKFVKPHLLDENPEFRTRFLNEARTLGRLEHDRIVRLYSVLNTTEALALVLAFIDGHSLAKDIDERGALPVPYVLSVAKDVLPALGFAHERGIIHRDIKAENIMIDRIGRAFLSDFGIAVTEFSQRGTVAGSAIGTPGYMSPEQIRDSRAISAQTGGHRSDIYSFGVLLFEMLTGKLPFPGEGMSVIHAHLMVAPPSLREINPQVSPSLENVVMRCLDKEPGGRPQTCADLLQDLIAAAAGAPEGRAPTVFERPKTVFEGASDQVRGSGTSVMGANAIAPSNATPVSSPRKKGVPLAAWLAMGGVLMASGVGYAIYNASRPAPKSETETVSESKPVSDSKHGTNIVTPKQNDSGTGQTGPAPGADSVTRARVAFDEAKALGASGRPCDGRPKAIEAYSLNPASPEYQKLQEELTKKCVAEKRADQLAQEAQALGQRGKACEGERKIDEAISLNPSKAEFQGLKGELGKACRATGDADRLASEAEGLFQRGEYCDADKKMVEAAARNPRYAARRETMREGCAASLR